MEIVVRATVIFFFIWGLMRALGKRELTQMTAFELTLLIVIGDLVQQGVTQEDMSLTGAMLAVGTIGMWVLLFSWIGFRFQRSRSILEGIPVVVIRDGKLQREAMRIERLTIDEVADAARQDGVEDLSEVRLGIVEPDGKFSFLT
jgi:uncharacterized membrane protein YcaP (DUF421 family)